MRMSLPASNLEAFDEFSSASLPEDDARLMPRQRRKRRPEQRLRHRIIGSRRARGAAAVPARVGKKHAVRRQGRAQSIDRRDLYAASGGSWTRARDWFCSRSSKRQQQCGCNGTCENMTSHLAALRVPRTGARPWCERYNPRLILVADKEKTIWQPYHSGCCFKGTNQVATPSTRRKPGVRPSTPVAIKGANTEHSSKKNPKC